MNDPFRERNVRVAVDGVQRGKTPKKAIALVLCFLAPMRVDSTTDLVDHTSNILLPRSPEKSRGRCFSGTIQIDAQAKVEWNVPKSRAIGNNLFQSRYALIGQAGRRISGLPAVCKRAKKN
jgi:hypothetical protein